MANGTIIIEADLTEIEKTLKLVFTNRKIALDVKDQLVKAGCTVKAQKIADLE